jgi:nucleoside-diphosphate-sugar epimerase
MATLVTGGTGAVGSGIIQALAEQGHDVVCFDSTPADDLIRRFVAPWSERVAFVQGDILSAPDLELTAKDHKISQIVHGAATTPRSPSTFSQGGGTFDPTPVEKDHSRAVVDINTMGTVNLLDLAAALHVERFIYVSSGAVYGEGPDPAAPVTEDHPLNLYSLYAISKYAGELLARRYGEIHGFSAATVRVTFAYGPIERVTPHRTVLSVPYEWTRHLVRGEPIVVGDRTLGRDYTYMKDIGAGIGALLDAPSLAHNVYNLSPGRWTTLGDIVDVLKELRPSLEVIDDSSRLHDISTYPRGSVHGALDVSRIKADVGFSASYDIAAGLRDYVGWREEFPYQD